MKTEIEIKRLESEEETDSALALAEDVFMEFEAPCYPPRLRTASADFSTGSV